MRQVITSDVTVVIPTFQRPTLLRQTIDGVLASEVRPAHILVSDGTSDPVARSKTEAIVQSASSDAVNITLIPAPADGRMCGNRNHLIRAVSTPYVLLLDDDLLVEPSFIGDGLALLRAGFADAVDNVEVPLWFAFRGHWTQKRPTFYALPAVSTQPMLARTDLMQAEPFDEGITYGSEEAVMALRFQKRSPPVKVGHLSKMYRDLGANQTTGSDETEISRLIVDSRVLFGIRRYWDRRLSLALFLAVEVAASCARRQPAPRECTSGQWRSAIRHMVFLSADCP